MVLRGSQLHPGYREGHIHRLHLCIVCDRHQHIPAVKFKIASKSVYRRNNLALDQKLAPKKIKKARKDESTGDLGLRGLVDRLDLDIPPRQLSEVLLPQRLLVSLPALSGARSLRKESSGVCANCEGRFRSSTMRLGRQLCANCFKIVDSVSRTASRFGGQYRVVVRRVGHV